ncbi:zinc finger CCHC domain-containing protein 4 [Larimichthys crocea]|uniref:zinc finger CCHC domain-containing protein 4 n=1 Tax=Larimichthys crocea TaxID=215358 RepID=UPI0009015D6E|nr:zinc finger CCHC domain-containing protein 4 [Larimichthys crocea]
MQLLPIQAWRHCQSCSRCAIPDHPCGLTEGKEGCFNCGSLKHKRKACPIKDTHRVSRHRPGAKSGAKNVSHRHVFKAKGKRKSGAARRAKKMAALSV